MAGSPYHHNGKFSPNKARKESARKYATGTPEYRKEIDEIGCVFWGVIIGIGVFIFIIILILKGGDAASNWVK